MDLFVVDNVGDNDAQENRIVPTIPKTKSWRKPICFTSTSVSAKTKIATNEEDRVDAADEDEEDDDDDDGDYGGSYTEFN